MASQRRDNSGGSVNKHLDAAGKYVRYTTEQVEALERVYAECPKPSSLRRQQLIRECPILANIEPMQIKVWFQNRRCREKQRNESSRLQSVNRKLTAMNKLLMEENDRLQKQVSQLVYKNGYIRQQMQSATGTAADLSCEPAVTIPQPSLRDVSNPAGLLAIAEETLTDFLSKATGTAVDWVQMPGMKPGPDLVGIFAVSHNRGWVAARACGLVGLKPPKIAEILKDRTSWFHDCRNLEVFSSIPTANGGTIELVYTQMFAPTILAPARDLWTLRYTTLLENGSLVVCERSLSGSGAAPIAGGNFVRAEMLASGYLIRSCDGGGSSIHIVDHLNLDPWSVPEILRPLYTSSKLVAHKMTIAALQYVRQIAQESSGEVVHGFGRQPAVLRTFSQRLCRSFSDAINGFNDAGWSVMNCDGADDVIISVNSTQCMTSQTSATNLFPLSGGILCAKASMLLHNVPPAVLVRFLREHRSEWADFNVDAYNAASIKPNSFSFPGIRPTSFSGSQIIMPLGHTIENEEMLEVIRIEGHSLSPEDSYMSRDINLLQICSGIGENSTGACAELIFAPINDMFPDDVPLLPSGFRMIPLDTKLPDPHDQLNEQRTLDLTSSLDVNPATAQAPLHDTRSVLTIAFQFPFESNLQDIVESMARQYLRSVITSVQRIAVAIAPTGICPSVGPKPSLEALNLAQWICHSYCYHIGGDLLRAESSAGDQVLKHLWHHPNPILCCSIKASPILIFANKAGLEMLDTTLVALQNILFDTILDEAGRNALYSEFAKIMQQGYAYLPAGICLSSTGRHISYEQAVAWKVLAGDKETVEGLAFSFVNWSFL